MWEKKQNLTSKERKKERKKEAGDKNKKKEVKGYRMYGILAATETCKRGGWCNGISMDLGFITLVTLSDGNK